jgi:hypothetical protein
MASMKAFDVPPLPPGCPWSSWSPPTIHWCEENLCSWITAPANTWSNLAYLVVAVLLWRQARRDLAGAPSGANPLRFFAPAAAVVGVTSFLFHASYTWFFQFFDYVGMYALFFLAITLNLRRSGLLAPGFEIAAYLIGVAGTTALLPLLVAARIPVQLTIAFLTLVLLAQEAWLRWGKGQRPAYGPFLGALAALAIAVLFTVLDLTRAWCEPTRHWIQGHALWHVFTAIALSFLYFFYRPLLRPRP